MLYSKINGYVQITESVILSLHHGICIYFLSAIQIGNSLWCSLCHNLWGPVCFFNPPNASSIFCGSTQQNANHWAVAPLDLMLPMPSEVCPSRTSWVSPHTDTQAWNTFKVKRPGGQQSLCCEKSAVLHAAITAHWFKTSSPKGCCIWMEWRQAMLLLDALVALVDGFHPVVYSNHFVPVPSDWLCLQQKTLKYCSKKKRHENDLINGFAWKNPWLISFCAYILGHTNWFW